MTSTPYTTVTAISGASNALALPDGMTEDNTTIGATTPEPATFTNLTVTGTFTRTGGSAPLPPVVGGASATLTSAQTGKTILLSAASGTTLTLPAATGSGVTYKIVVSTTVTSNSHKVLAASSSDYINGIAIGYSGSTAKVFGSAATTNHSLQMPASGSTPSGGNLGDYIEIIDIAANTWNAEMVYLAGTTPTTPFSTATT